MAVTQQEGAEIAFGDQFRVKDMSDGERFKLSVECGEFFGPKDVQVKVLSAENRLLITGSRMQMSGAVQVSRQISYEHELPNGVTAEEVKAQWDPNDCTLVVEAPFNGAEP